MLNEIDSLIKQAKHDYNVILKTLETYNISGAEELLSDLTFMIDRLTNLKEEVKEIDKIAISALSDIDKSKNQMQEIRQTVE